jgi:CRP/FNR family transcriptional regulator, cyclic AMP receptor protein
MINPFKKTYTEKELSLFRFLSGIKLFERLSPEEMSYFTPYLHLREYKENEVVFFTNDPSHALYILKSGRVSLNVAMQQHFEELAVLHSGKAFGENALIEKTRRHYTGIVISEKAWIYVVPQVNIQEIFEDHVQIKAKMLTSLTEMNDANTAKLFKEYRTSFGFFNLSEAMKD